MSGLPLDMPGWVADAACATAGFGLADAWFPDKGSSTREAKAVCGTCIVRAECLTWALEHNERHGVWGGLSERERRALRGDTTTTDEDTDELTEEAS